MDDDQAQRRAVAPEQGGGAAEELAYRLRQQQLTVDFGRYAFRTHDTNALLQEATRVCALGLHATFCKVMEFLPEEQQFIVRAGVGWKPGVVGRARMGADRESPTGYAFETGEPVISNHLAKETRFRTPALLADHGIKRALNVLIQGDGGRFGILEVDSPMEGRFTDADQTFLQGFANLLGGAIERQQVEEALQASEARAQKAVALQEMLTREISHRVKNSLAMVAGLLNMQRRAATDPALQQALEEACTRVTTIARLHDRLWRADEVQSINLAEFMGELSDQIRTSIIPGQTLTCEFAPVMLATDQAVPLALLVNELVTNAFKYAYPGGEGDVRLTIKVGEPGHLTLTVSDSGQGLPEGIGTTNGTSLGMKLIASLSHQMGGTPEWQNANPGTRFVLDFVAQEHPSNHEDDAAPRA